MAMRAVEVETEEPLEWGAEDPGMTIRGLKRQMELILSSPGGEETFFGDSPFLHGMSRMRFFSLLSSAAVYVEKELKAHTLPKTTVVIVLNWLFGFLQREAFQRRQGAFVQHLRKLGRFAYGYLKTNGEFCGEYDLGDLEVEEKMALLLSKDDIAKRFRTAFCEANWFKPLNDKISELSKTRVPRAKPNERRNRETLQVAMKRRQNQITNIETTLAPRDSNFSTWSSETQALLAHDLPQDTQEDQEKPLSINDELNHSAPAKFALIEPWLLEQALNNINLMQEDSVKRISAVIEGREDALTATEKVMGDLARIQLLLQEYTDKVTLRLYEEALDIENLFEVNDGYDGKIDRSHASSTVVTSRKRRKVTQQVISHFQ